jgi:SAM-dependent methyltransferase
MRTALDVATDDVFAFVESALDGGGARSAARPESRLGGVGGRSPPTVARRVLEVGAGRGHLAKKLREAGYDVVAIDADRDRAGEGVEVASFPEYETSARFDAVLFTRSLHHIHALDASVDKARSLLAPGGAIVVDDFAWEDVDLPTAAWAYGSLAVADKEHWKDDGDPLAAWMKKYREHHIHESRAIAAALEKRFSSVAAGRGSYFWRYLPDETPDVVAEIVRHTESELGAGGAIRLIGARMVAR